MYIQVGVHGGQGEEVFIHGVEAESSILKHNQLGGCYSMSFITCIYKNFWQ